MHSIPLAENLLWFADTLGYVAVIVRVASTGLHRVYPGFFAYLVFRALRSGGLRLLDPSRNAYGWAWLLTEPLVWVLFAYAAFELSSIALREYRGLASFSRSTLIAGVVICLIASLTSLFADVSLTRVDFPVLLAVNLARRAVCFTLTLYLLVLAGFLLWLPVPITRNLLLHTVLLSLYSFAGTATLFVRNFLGPSVIPQVSTALLVVSVLCLAGWLGMSRAGEHKPAVARLHWRPETERQMLEQLSALNATLARSAGARPGESKLPR